MSGQENAPGVTSPSIQAALQQVQPAVNIAPSPTGENLRCQWVGCTEVAGSAEQLYVKENPMPSHP